MVAEVLQRSGIGTLLFDLLTRDEASDRDNVFDVDFLAHRLLDATQWVEKHIADDLPIGYFGASTGAAAALTAAAYRVEIAAVVSRGGRPDLALRHLGNVRAPTLVIVGGADYGVIELNERAYTFLRCEKSLEIVPGATHLFEEPGALEQVADLASGWFKRHLTPRHTAEKAKMDPLVYSTREEAGHLLAARLSSYKGPDVVVLGVPRGGLPVARVVADRLGAPLDVVVVRKLGAPGQPELGIGAVVDGDQPRAIFNQDMIESLGISSEYIEAEISRQIQEVRRRDIAYHGGRPKIPLEGKTVIVVDDGIATGSSIRAALRGVRRAHPKRVILAIPVAPAETLEALRAEANEIVCLETPLVFYAVSQFYRDFHQVTDDEVRHLLCVEQLAEAHV
jgi:predicted phosphoribosyltransferase